MGLTDILNSYCARRQKEKELSLLTELNHQLRTPLNGIIASLSLFPHATEEEQKELISIMEQSAGIMQSALDHILQSPKKEAMPEHGNTPIKKVLIVEDNTFNQQLLVKMLDKLNTEHAIASTIEEARLQLAQQSFDLVFMDVHLPDGYGDELAVETKELFPETRIYMLTADVLLKEKAVNLSFIDGIVFKPFRLEQIREIIHPL